MELNTIFLCTTIGALVGTIVGILLMNRKIRLPITGADLAAMRTKLEASESSLAAATSTAEDLRKQIAEREQTIQQQKDELKTRQEQIDKSGAQIEKDKLQRSVNEQLSQELSTQNGSLLKERNELDSSLQEERKLAAERASQIATLEAQLNWAAKQVEELTGRVDGLTAEGAALRSFREQESKRRVAVEAQLSAEQERLQQLSAQVAELEGERSRFDLRLQEERETAARGMELLLKAQENFSRVLSPANGEARTGPVRKLAVEQPALLEAHSESNGSYPSSVD